MGEEKKMLTQYAAVPAYVTRDGSVIRELMHPGVHGNRNQSLAEARVPEGGETLAHKHPRAEELYHFTAGQGVMELDDETIEVRAGDTVCIDPGTVHRVRNTGEGDLVIVCCCAPAYSHEDTVLV
jgi:mannose-6-phosphate isomerase-like protein (cupin superfamily)